MFGIKNSTYAGNKEFYLSGYEYFRYDILEGGCVPNITYGDTYILGAPFFQQYYTIFDFDHNKAAFFRQTNNPISYK